MPEKILYIPYYLLATGKIYNLQIQHENDEYSKVTEEGEKQQKKVVKMDTPQNSWCGVVLTMWPTGIYFSTY